MSLHLLVKKDDGNLTVSLRDGLVIGRAAVDISLNDPTISSKHAEIKRDQDGRWILYDLGSRNGITFGDKKVQSLRLSLGVKFYIGRILFETIDVEDTVATAPPLAQSPPKEVLLAPEEWQDKIARMARSVQKSVSAGAKKISPLNPALRLSIASGVQHKSTWVVGYGPRAFGSEQPEFSILESGAPATCFILTQGPTGVIFSTDYPDKVLLNGRATKSDVIKVGDEILISQTKIVVEPI